METKKAAIRPREGAWGTTQNHFMLGSKLWGHLTLAKQELGGQVRSQAELGNEGKNIPARFYALP